MKRFRAFLLILFFTVRICAGSSIEEGFLAANKLYEEGKYSAAAAAYESLLKSGNDSFSLHFNLGNALFKDGRMGQAIVAYRLAAELQPREPRLRNNLSLARASVPQGSTVSDSAWRTFMTRDEWLVLAAVAFNLFFAALVAVEVRPSWKKNSRPFLLGLGTLAFLIVGVALSAAWLLHHSPTFVITTKEAVVRRGPLDESQSFYTSADGTELKVLDQSQDWVEVADSSGRRGWTLKSQGVLLR
jgi:tetratricopeptide (TPR) repeat protein